ncbi:MAG TPA: protein-methionine-sulfoxide reductase catalytic subunit MsrP [Gammaproteobacteria bacterium]|nr:protein-methionine-sulfoxide reductase catalytic subunit MsrP [Gammaproteobacteria bacterium]
MLIRKRSDLRDCDVTPKNVYLNRRAFLGASAGLIGAAALPGTAKAAMKLDNLDTSGKYHQLGNDMITPEQSVTTYNNYYEFGTGKEDPSRNAPRWKPNPEWTIAIGGEVMKPKTLALDDVMKLAPLEERIYRMRCVEAWSVVVPWVGFSLSTLLKQVEPTSKAKYVAFETYYNPREMLSPRQAGIPFPYVEGLRIDEAMHPLTLLTFGMYGETLPNQDGAPVRIIVPWKYGFKGIKSIVKVTFTEKEPPATWNLYAPNEYGFYSNVNPERDHPRWSQKTEQRLGGGFLGLGTRIETQKFNGYGEQVADLYRGMDLIRKYY